MAGSAVNLSGMLNNLALTPFRGAASQEGLLGSLGAALAPRSPVDTSNPEAMAAHGQQLIAQGRVSEGIALIKQAQAMANAKQSERDQLQPIEPIAGVERNNAMGRLAVAKAASERGAKDATAEQLRAQKVAKVMRSLGKDAEADAFLQVTDPQQQLALMRAAFREEATHTPADTVALVRKSLKDNASFKTYHQQQTQAERALDLIDNSSDNEQSGALIQRVVSEIYNGDTRAASEIDRFQQSRGITTSISDWLKKVTTGTLSEDTKANLRKIAKIAHDSAARKKSAQIEKELLLYGIDDPARVKAIYAAYGSTPPVTGDEEDDTTTDDAATPVPVAGDVVDGWMFKGGPGSNPNDPTLWERVE